MTSPNPFPALDDGETVFTVPASTIKYGPEALNELGDDAHRLGMTRTALFTDEHVVETEPLKTALDALMKAGVETVVFDAVKVEPTDDSFRVAAQFASEGNFDGYISLGGGSVIDTAKIANLLATHPDDLMAYVNAPIGQAKPVPGPIKPHIACPTTCGTGSETTGVAVFDLVREQVKTGISSIHLRPALALVDPVTTESLPAGVIAATGFDVLTHAIESFTARPYRSREKPELGSRPPYQGANPFSDIGAEAAIRIGGEYLVAAVREPDNIEARHQLMFAATLAGQAFGNAGVHIPHAMSYSVAGLNHEYVAKGYENANPMIPHGLSVVINAPAAFRFTGPAGPERHLQAAAALGADTSNAAPLDGGELLALRLSDMMQATGLPSGLAEIGYSEDDIPALVKGSYAQQRLLAQAPCPVSEENLADIYRAAMKYW
ncbi:MAG: iron-containing alcohol dehydrogenase [Rhodospirillaceae bacterium]|jgi:hydroxyacid-oxoacid transhydrogenase|nr:iron-containing alcohol dehydrogenase [Rhodospirillaceae bacterium]MBT5245873.1 iron-containing alcohol dehydrogenase [Rhodospirillaceae bacterium]MBT5561180.1 iron-containing alcohol dehydrogenase [Rhodospirillaceae bacterium]MBT6242874.1 iron-containing alcohol dehydrogenase [Rhodospirillaceae bacterium]